jgi:hypothetical protein
LELETGDGEAVGGGALFELFVGGGDFRDADLEGHRQMQGVAGTQGALGFADEVRASGKAVRVTGISRRPLRQKRSKLSQADLADSCATSPRRALTNNALANSVTIQSAAIRSFFGVSSQSKISLLAASRKKIGMAMLVSR